MTRALVLSVGAYLAVFAAGAWWGARRQAHTVGRLSAAHLRATADLRHRLDATQRAATAACRLAYAAGLAAGEDTQRTELADEGTVQLHQRRNGGT